MENKKIHILAIDDEEYVLENLVRSIRSVFANAVIYKTHSAEKVKVILKELNEQNIQIRYAFIDIRLRGTSGIELSRVMKEWQHDIKIIFCTAYAEYAIDAFSVHALGYLLKPVRAEQIIETLEHMDADWKAQAGEQKEICVQTFGMFEIFINGRALTFERKKAKELLAYLVDQKGASVTTAQIAAVLWEDRFLDRNATRDANTIISSLRKTLKNAGIEDLLVKSWNHTAIDISKIKCDAYEFYKGDLLAINSYRGKYLENYSWAEFTNAGLAQKLFGMELKAGV